MRALKSVRKSETATLRKIVVTTLPYSIGGMPSPAKTPEIYACMHACVCVCVYYVRVCVCMCVCMYVCMYVEAATLRKIVVTTLPYSMGGLPSPTKTPAIYVYICVCVCEET